MTDDYIMLENKDPSFSQYQFGNYHVSKVLGVDKIGRLKTKVIAKFITKEDAELFAAIKNSEDDFVGGK